MTRPILILCPQAVGAAWQKTFQQLKEGFDAWKHQIDGADWMSRRKAGLLAMEMGCGKSLTAMLACGVTENCELLDVTSGKTDQRMTALNAFLETCVASETRGIVVMNYDVLPKAEVQRTLNQVRWGAIICDESQRIKSAKTKGSKYLATLARRNPEAKRLCLTGTPLTNGPLDAFGQFRFLDPDVFGANYYSFFHRYAVPHPVFKSQVLKGPGGRPRYINMDEFNRKFDAMTFRVTAEEVLELPDAVHQQVPVTLSPKVRRIYDQFAKEMVVEIGDGVLTVENALGKLLRLQQITSGYVKLDDETTVQPIGESAKAAALDTLLDGLPADEPVVVFCKFRADLEEVHASARRCDRGSYEISGTTKDLTGWLQHGNNAVLAVQIAAGSTGIDLTAARHCIYYSVGFSLADYLQSLARCHRPGQTRKVFYHHLVATRTVDEHIYRALQNKQDVIGGVMESLTDRLAVA